MHDRPIDRPSISAPKFDDNLSCVTYEGSKKYDDEKRAAQIRTIVEEVEKNDKEADYMKMKERRMIMTMIKGRLVRFVLMMRMMIMIFLVRRVLGLTSPIRMLKINDGHYNKVGLKDVTPVAATISSSTKVAM
ncbi:hypothetical protein RND71_010218 [Anisodus tanguticus]|uniref:Uncharacterized protein n=1 Tax=Anisodus tanguticus TaxID=243964 RepID=A0AAE1SJX4_9SOLA|nr:hypothetical protein RND71_010218 [Anisodus tanguticus]